MKRTPAYFMFNNQSMFEDARRFERMIGRFRRKLAVVKGQLTEIEARERGKRRNGKHGSWW